MIKEKSINLLKKIDIDNFESLDEFIALTQPYGSIKQSTTNNMYGFNQNVSPAILKENKDRDGYVFFVRPQFCLTDENLKTHRQLYSLCNTDKNSVHCYVRSMLDPRVAKGLGCKLMNNRSGFIPIATNTIKTLSGFTDMIANVDLGKPGVRGQRHLRMEGHVDLFSDYDLDCNFKNTIDEPLVLLFQTWLSYMAAVTEGRISPYIDFITENEYDYNTRIYRLVTDKSGDFVKKIACTGIAIPTNIPTGKFFDFDKSSVYQKDTKDINIRFKCVGSMYNEDIILKEFNEVSIIFDNELNEVVKNKFKSTKRFFKIPRGSKQILNYRGVPLIDYETLELTWWIRKDSKDYKYIMGLQYPKKKKKKEEE